VFPSGLIITSAGSRQQSLLMFDIGPTSPSASSVDSQAMPSLRRAPWGILGSGKGIEVCHAVASVNHRLPQYRQPPGMEGAAM
jgi:hypothetical protein